MRDVSHNYVVGLSPFLLRITVLFRKLIGPCADGSVFSNFTALFHFLFFFSFFFSFFTEYLKSP